MVDDTGLELRKRQPASFWPFLKCTDYKGLQAVAVLGDTAFNEAKWSI